MILALVRSYGERSESYTDLTLPTADEYYIRVVVDKEEEKSLNDYELFSKESIPILNETTI